MNYWIKSFRFYHKNNIIILIMFQFIFYCILIIGLLHFSLYYMNVNIIQLYKKNIIHEDNIIQENNIIYEDNIIHEDNITKEKYFNEMIEQLQNSINEFKHNEI